MHRCLSTSTMPSARLKEAPVGQTSTHGGSSQCWHIIGSASVRPLRMSLSSTLRIHCESVGLNPPDKPFSLLHAVTQSLQPSAQFAVSISMPQRTLLETASDLPCAISNSNIPGAMATAAAPTEVFRNYRRCTLVSLIWTPSAPKQSFVCWSDIQNNRS